MLELLIVPTAALTYALVSDKFKRKDDDKRKFKSFLR
ncbi:hypothetical protein DJ45_1941 [Bacillus anthracis]|nr:hypothetical protein DJ45_1941 [Bacillus anthracis]